MSIAAVLVTHDSAQFIEATLRSVMAQSIAPELIVIVDDNSTDATVSLIHGQTGTSSIPVIIQASETGAADTHTRISQNFMQGVRLAQEQGADITVLGDHDDLWHEDRIARHAKVLADNPTAMMVAADGRVMRDERPTQETLRDAFPVPQEFNSWRASQQFHYAVRHSVATGGASALRPAGFQHFAVPHGWLHDRWWSLAASAHHALVIDPAPVIDYRISDVQQIGLDTAVQQVGTAGSLAHHASNLQRTTKRLVDLVPLFIASR
jgi:glycosyltransferase involved in cell wall biosynthesis